MKKNNGWRRHGYALAIVLFFLLFTSVLIGGMFFIIYADLDSMALSKQQMLQRVTLENLEAEARGYLLNELRKGHQPRYTDEGFHGTVRSMDDLRLYPKVKNSGSGNRVTLYDISFDVPDPSFSGKSKWGHREQDFYPPMPGAYLIRAIVDPEDKNSPEVMLEVVWCMNGNQLQREPRLRQEILQPRTE